MKYPNEDTSRTDDGRVVVAYILAELNDSHFVFNFTFEEDAVDFAATSEPFARSVLQTLTIMHDQFEAHVAMRKLGGRYNA